MAESEVADRLLSLSGAFISRFKRKATSPSPSSKIDQKKAKGTVHEQDEALADTEVVLIIPDGQPEAPGESPKAVGIEATTEDEDLEAKRLQDEKDGVDLQVRATTERLMRAMQRTGASRSAVENNTSCCSTDLAGTAATDESMPKPVDCIGITKEMIRCNSNLGENDKILDGFCHLVGEGLHNFASMESDQKESPYDYDPKIVGMLKFNGSDIITLSRINGSRTYAFRSTGCVGTIEDGKKAVLCKPCFFMTRSFYRRCKKGVDSRNPDTEFHRKTTLSVMSSPAQLRERIASDGKLLQHLRVKLNRAEKKNMSVTGDCKPAVRVDEKKQPTGTRCKGQKAQRSAIPSTSPSKSAESSDSPSRTPSTSVQPSGSPLNEPSASAKPSGIPSTNQQTVDRESKKVE
jgi:hypothetical protein